MIFDRKPIEVGKVCDLGIARRANHISGRTLKAMSNNLAMLIRYRTPLPTPDGITPSNTWRTHETHSPPNRISWHDLVLQSLAQSRPHVFVPIFFVRQFG